MSSSRQWTQAAARQEIARWDLAEQRRLLAWLRRQVDAADQQSAEDWQPPGSESAIERRHIGKSCFLLQGVKCGKANCKCAAGDLHGPYWYEFWREGDKVKKRYHGKQIKLKWLATP
ncbi:DUF6788 family protein [Sphaerothrix gracilis]|uniref:DUF6788 family protein n=1 Tax=Sphaerothrix gracilis TaxID=3151835 RepID=UPI0031FC98C6